MTRDDFMIVMGRVTRRDNLSWHGAWLGERSGRRAGSKSSCDNAVTTFCCHTLCVPLTLPLLLPADHDSEAKITNCSEHMTTIRSTGLLSSDKRENVCDLRIKEQGGSARWWIRVSLSSDVEWCHFDNDCDSDGRRERQLAFKWWPSPRRYHRFNPNRNDVYSS